MCSAIKLEKKRDQEDYLGAQTSNENATYPGTLRTHNHSRNHGFDSLVTTK